MAAAAAIFEHQLAAGRALSPLDASGSTAGTSGMDTSGSSDSGSATISANDFLTLLVTEMQNQDPTADTDPNEYIDQLVQVNSLEQLIDINQTLSGALGSSTNPSGSNGASNPPAQAAGQPADAHRAGMGIHSIAHAGSAPVANYGSLLAAHPAPAAGGNLSVPAASAAAQRVGHALDGHAPASGAGLGRRRGAL